jgi:hypothetical protein
MRCPRVGGEEEGGVGCSRFGLASGVLVVEEAVPVVPGVRVEASQAGGEDAGGVGGADGGGGFLAGGAFGLEGETAAGAGEGGEVHGCG